MPDGIANSSGMVGRNYMAPPDHVHRRVRPGRENRLVFQKTLGVNDWYHAGPDNPFPLGNVQALGKLQGWTIKSQRKAIPQAVLEWMTQRSVDFLAESEDLPLRDSRVTVDDAGRVHLGWIPTNVACPRGTRPPDRTGDPQVRVPTDLHPAPAVVGELASMRDGDDGRGSSAERCQQGLQGP